MNHIEWQHQNLINVALDVGCTETEIRATFTGDFKFREFLEKQLQKVIADRKAEKAGVTK